LLREPDLFSLNRLAGEAGLFQHFTNLVARSLTLPGPIGRAWEDRIPQLALSSGNAYLIHAVLAVSAAFRVYRSPNDIDNRRLGFLNYGESVKCLGQSLACDGASIDSCTALATAILLTWYEVSVFC
jgi:Fungal specific transcription factor domain